MDEQLHSLVKTWHYFNFSLFTNQMCIKWSHCGFHLTFWIPDEYNRLVIRSQTHLSPSSGTPPPPPCSIFLSPLQVHLSLLDLALCLNRLTLMNCIKGLLSPYVVRSSTHGEHKQKITGWKKADTGVTLASSDCQPQQAGCFSLYQSTFLQLHHS